MKKDEVRVGSTYSAKVGTAVVPVRITAEKWNGDKHAGWVGTNTTTGRTVRIKSAQRLRREVGERAAATPGAKGGVPRVAGGTVAQGVPDAGAVPEAGPLASDATAANVGGEGASVETPSASEPARNRHVGPGGKRVPKAAMPKPETSKRVSALDAAAQVLASSREPMSAKQIVAEMEAKGLWRSPGGRTPQATLYAAVIREIAAKGRESRFRKTDRGLFTAARGA